MFDLRKNFIAQQDLTRDFINISQRYPYILPAISWKNVNKMNIDFNPCNVNEIKELVILIGTSDLKNKIQELIDSVDQQKSIELMNYIVPIFLNTFQNHLILNQEETCSITECGSLIAFMYLNFDFRARIFKIASSRTERRDLSDFDIFTARNIVRRYSFIDGTIDILKEQKEFLLCFLIFICGLSAFTVRSEKINILERFCIIGLRDFLKLHDTYQSESQFLFESIMVLYKLLRETFNIGNFKMVYELTKRVTKFGRLVYNDEIEE